MFFRVLVGRVCRESGGGTGTGGGRLAGASRPPPRATRRTEWTAAPRRVDSPCGHSTGRVDLAGVASGRVSRGDSTPHARRVAGRAVHSLTPLDPPPLARRPQPGSTRRREWAPAEGESTARHYRARRHFLCGPFLHAPPRQLGKGGEQVGQHHWLVTGDARWGHIRPPHKEGHTVSPLPVSPLVRVERSTRTMLVFPAFIQAAVVACEDD